SAIYRHGWLARKLRLSVREMVLLIEATGLDPFASIDPPRPPIVLLLELVEALRAVGLKTTQALYLVWDYDLTGKSTPPDEQIYEFAQRLRRDLIAIASQFGSVDDPTGAVARMRMALVYGAEATDFFFG